MVPTKPASVRRYLSLLVSPTLIASDQAHLLPSMWFETLCASLSWPPSPTASPAPPDKDTAVASTTASSRCRRWSRAQLATTLASMAPSSPGGFANATRKWLSVDAETASCATLMASRSRRQSTRCESRSLSAKSLGARTLAEPRALAPSPDRLGCGASERPATPANARRRPHQQTLVQIARWMLRRPMHGLILQPLCAS